MGKVWVLDTQTKGTGARMVPLESVLHKPGSEEVPGFVLPKRKPPAAGSPEPPAPRSFKLVDVMTREVVGEDLDAHTTVDLLGDVRSIVDVEIFVWEPKSGRWRLLTLAESKALWDYRRRAEAAEPAGEPQSSAP